MLVLVPYHHAYVCGEYHLYNLLFKLSRDMIFFFAEVRSSFFLSVPKYNSPYYYSVLRIFEDRSRKINSDWLEN